MLLIYSLERTDILPVDDFGVREGYRRLKGLEKALTPRRMREIGAAWSPFPGSGHLVSVATARPLNINRKNRSACD